MNIAQGFFPSVKCRAIFKIRLFIAEFVIHIRKIGHQLSKLHRNFRGSTTRRLDFSTKMSIEIILTNK